MRNNPLFARVSTNVDRANRGEAIYTPSEYINIKNASDDGNNDYSAEYKDQLEKLCNLDTSDFGHNKEEDPFEKAFKDRLSQLK